MNGMKQWYQSKTVWGALIAILAGLLQAGGVDVGGLLALYGRLMADKKVG